MTDQRPGLFALSLGAAAFAGAGLLAGYLLFAPRAAPQDTPGQQQPAPAAPAPGADASAEAARPSPATAAPAAPAAPARPATAGPGPDPAPASPRNEDADSLARKVAELQSALALEKKLLLEAERGPAKPPADLADRFSGEAFRKALQDGLKEAGFDGQITSIDCTEYPCIAYGEGQGFSDMSEVGAVLRSGPLTVYNGDEKRVWAYDAKPNPDGSPRQLFGLTIYPKEAAENAAIRLDYRIRQMEEAVK